MSEWESLHGDEHQDQVRGVAVGKVTDNEDPKGIGRVKVSYPWRDADDESYWARIATEMTGNDMGTWFLPDVDDEVLVAFENGDIHHPFVIGSLYSGNRKPPHDNSDGDNDYQTIKSRSGHTVELDDDDQEPKVVVETNGGRKIELEDKSGSEKITIDDGSNTIEMDKAGGEVKIEGQQKISLSAPTIELSGDSKISLSSKSEVKIEGKAKVDVSSKGQLKVESSGLGQLKASGPLTIKGAIISLN